MEKKKTQEEKKREEKNKNSLIEKLERERDEYLEGWKRARADYMNYKKNEKARAAKIKKREKEKFIKEILEVIDNFELAEDNIPEEKKGDDCIQGFLKIKKQLMNILKNYGLEAVDSIGEKFDPNLHEAVVMVESEKESGTIISEIKKGYLLNGELLRPAKVKVAK